MNRRKFVQSSVATLASSLSTVGMRADPAGSEKSELSPPAGKWKIQYVRQEIPAIQAPPNHGQTYDDRVPDTLDIAERAKLGVNALTSVTDPAADYHIYWVAEFYRNPPVMRHDYGDYGVQVIEGFLEALPLLRVATGDENSPVDVAWMQSFLRCLGPDGLFYAPLNVGPWPRPKKSRGLVWRANGTTSDFSDESVTQVASGQMCARAIGTMTVYYLRDGNPMWKESVEGMIRRLSALSVDKGDWCYLPAGFFEPGAKVGPNAEMLTGFQAGEMNGRLIQGLSQYYKVTGHEPALELARKLNRYFKDHAQCYDAQGRFLWSESDRQSLSKKFHADGETVGGHSHLHTIGLLSMLEYATAAKDQETMEFVKASFDWAKSQADAFGVSKLVGWFPEWYLPEYPTCESCTVADIVGLALKLSVAGIGDYWDDVDRWVRNDFAEQQLTSADWVYHVASSLPRKPLAWNESADRAVERNIGAFAGWSTANEWGRSIMHCCTGNSTRTLYYIWEHMLEKEGGQLRVNLLLNRASAWADVYSFIPYEGRVELKIKAPCEKVLVRAPEWIGSGGAEIWGAVNGTVRTLRWEGRYVNVGDVKPGDVVVVTFPDFPFRGYLQSERAVQEKIGPVTYTLTLRGNTVVAIDPPGTNGPLYQRAAYRGDRVQWREVRRFVPDQVIRW